MIRHHQCSRKISIHIIEVSMIVVSSFVIGRFLHTSFGYHRMVWPYAVSYSGLRRKNRFLFFILDKRWSEKRVSRSMQLPTNIVFAEEYLQVVNSTIVINIMINTRTVQRPLLLVSNRFLGKFVRSWQGLKSCSVAHTRYVQ